MIIWLDIETTGLDPNKDSILEVAMTPTDGRGFILAESFHSLVDYDGFISNEKVRAMHSASGLLKDLEHPDLPSLDEVERMACRYVSGFLVHPSQIIVGGRNPGFDLGFLKARMPLLEKMLGFRTIDVLAFERAYKEAGIWIEEQPKKTHRALQDLSDDIEFYQWVIRSEV